MNLPGYTQPVLTEEDFMAAYESLTTDAAHRLTLCEQLRFIYDVVDKLEDQNVKQDLTDKLVIALNMAKKMNSRLAHYKRNYPKEGNGGKNLPLLKDTDERKQIRQTR